MKLEVDKFYSWSSFVTVAGMASMLWVVVGTLSKAFEWAYPSWFPLVLAMFFVVLGDFGHRARDARLADLPVRLPLWIVNSCLVYTTAVGGANALTPTPSAGNGGTAEAVVADAPTRRRVDEPAPEVELPAPSATPTPAPPSSTPAPSAIPTGASPATDPEATPAAEAPTRSTAEPRSDTETGTPVTTEPRMRRPVTCDVAPAIRVRPSSTGFGRIVDEPLL